MVITNESEHKRLYGQPQRKSTKAKEEPTETVPEVDQKQKLVDAIRSRGDLSKGNKDKFCEILEEVWEK